MSESVKSEVITDAISSYVRRAKGQMLEVKFWMVLRIRMEVGVRFQSQPGHKN